MVVIVAVMVVVAVVMVVVVTMMMIAGEARKHTSVSRGGSSLSGARQFFQFTRLRIPPTATRRPSRRSPPPQLKFNPELAHFPQPFLHL